MGAGNPVIVRVPRFDREQHHTGYSIMIYSKENNVMVPCLTCGGYGYTRKGMTDVPDKVCFTCKGNGYVDAAGSI